MTSHLEPDEFTAALDDALVAERARHLDACAACRAELGRLRELADDLSRESVPEPPPEFWEAFGARVRAATAAEPMPGRAWRAGRSLAALGAIAAGLLLVLVWSGRLDRIGSDGDETVVEQVVERGAPANGWLAIAEMAADMSTDDLVLVTASATGAVSALGDLSPDERETFVRLVQLEMGDPQ